ncbi:ionic transporter [Xanthobacter sp. DSM 24535]|uniref:calcium:proton antiporter n=1 Tax=Roseixanthobacter psychrophilus TaxID=3119917 RepID=UPI00372AFC6F
MRSSQGALIAMIRRLFPFVVPVAGLVLALGWPVFFPLFGRGAEWLASLLMMGTIFAAVNHADTVSARLPQPFGTLVLTFSVTLIEASVLVSMMLNGENNPTLAREAVLSTVMFVLTGVVGLCLLIGGLRHREQEVRQQGLSGFLSVIMAISVLALILPSATSSGEHGVAKTLDVALIMVGVVLLYGSFLFMQTVRHRDHFLGWDESEERVATPVEFWRGVVFLLVSLGGVVLLSHYVAEGVERFMDRQGLPDPDAVVGAIVVAILLLPETITAVRSARRNRLQRALNAALGSALATIGLTMPVMVAVSYIVDRQVTLALDPEDRVQLLLALVLSIVSFGTGKTNALTGLVHLVLFLVYVLTLFSP